MGRRAGSRNRATTAAAWFLEGEFEALTRKAAVVQPMGELSLQIRCRCSSD